MLYSVLPTLATRIYKLSKLNGVYTAIIGKGYYSFFYFRYYTIIVMCMEKLNPLGGNIKGGSYIIHSAYKGKLIILELQTLN